jgi:hypothetical protein
VHADSIKVLENTGLDYTAVCLWKLAVGGGEVEAVENGWSETAADSQGVAGFVEGEVPNPHFARKTVFLRNKQ